VTSTSRRTRRRPPGPRHPGATRSPGSPHAARGSLRQVRPGAVEASVEMAGDGRARVTATVPSLNLSLTASAEVAAPSRSSQGIAARADDGTAGRGRPRGQPRGQRPRDDLWRGPRHGRLDDLEATVFEASVEALEGQAYGVAVRLARPARIRIAAERDLHRRGRLRVGADLGRRQRPAHQRRRRTPARHRRRPTGDLVPIAARLTGRPRSRRLVQGRALGHRAGTRPAPGGQPDRRRRPRAVRWLASRGRDRARCRIGGRPNRVAPSLRSSRRGQHRGEWRCPAGLLRAGLPQRVLHANPAQGPASLSPRRRTCRFLPWQACRRPAGRRHQRSR